MARELISKEFESLGFIEDIKKCKNIEERFALYNEIMALDKYNGGIDFVILMLAQNTGKLGFIEDINRCDNVRTVRRKFSIFPGNKINIFSEFCFQQLIGYGSPRLPLGRLYLGS